MRVWPRSSGRCHDRRGGADQDQRQTLPRRHRVHPTGVAAYHKQHLHGPEHDFFTAGTHGVTLSVDDTTVALAICADIGHAAHAAARAAAGAQIYAAGVMLTPEAYAPDAALMAHYAEEHHLVTLLANYSGATGGYQTAGRSAIWDDTGQQIAASDDHAECLVIAAPRQSLLRLRRWKS